MPLLGGENADRRVVIWIPKAAGMRGRVAGGTTSSCSGLASERGAPLLGGVDAGRHALITDSGSCGAQGWGVDEPGGVCGPLWGGGVVRLVFQGGALPILGEGRAGLGVHEHTQGAGSRGPGRLAARARSESRGPEAAEFGRSSDLCRPMVFVSEEALVQVVLEPVGHGAGGKHLSMIWLAVLFILAKRSFCAKRFWFLLASSVLFLMRQWLATRQMARVAWGPMPPNVSMARGVNSMPRAMHSPFSVRVFLSSASLMAQSGSGVRALSPCARRTWEMVQSWAAMAHLSQL